MFKLRQELLSMPYVSSSIQILYQIKNVHLKTTHTYGRQLCLNNELQQDIALQLQKKFATNPVKIVYAIKQSENGIITSGEFKNMCYALDELIYLSRHEGGYRSYALIDLMIEPGRGHLLGYQREEHFSSDHVNVEAWIESYGLTELMPSHRELLAVGRYQNRMVHECTSLCA